MDLDALRYGNFAKLGEAITDWQQMVNRLSHLKEVAERDLRAKANRADWAGVNAAVSREFIAKTAGEFSDAHTQANTTVKILSDTRNELTDFRTQINTAIENGLKKDLAVTDTGGGSFTVSPRVHPVLATAEQPSQRDVDTVRDEVQRILNKATESDKTAAEALRLIVDQAKYGFSDASYSDRDSAADAVKAGKASAALAKRGRDISPEQLKKLNHQIRKYRNDDLFSEKFAESMGAKGTLQFWADITDSNSGTP
ncbi:hypothetical protein [Streptomyces sp. NPDC087300]|uniref:hypothetical protein n=1 Tax=Streptomyces sp. NPDC087300 TaxID=3365780 RepID=UPI00383099C6